MYKLAILGTAALSLVLVSSADSFAKNNKGMSPGHKMQKYGSKPGYPGASGYAPGQVKKMRGTNTRASAPQYRVR
jgi:hypothetical protein